MPLTRRMLGALLATGLAVSALLAGTSPAPAAPTDTAVSVSVSDPTKDVNYYGKDRSAAAVAATKASDIRSATFTISGTGETATVTARIKVARLLGKKHSYDQVVGLYASNTIYAVHSNGNHTFTKRPDPTCTQATHTTSGRTVTITIPVPCMASNLTTSMLNARTWYHRNPNGFTVGGDDTAQLTIDYKALTLTNPKAGQ